MAIDLEKFLLDATRDWNEIVRKNDCKAAEEFLNQLTEIGYKFESPLNFHLFCSFMKILLPKTKNFFSSVKAEESETTFYFLFKPEISDDDGDDATVEEDIVLNQADIETVLPGPVED
jgi:hypothetical protein